MKTSTIILEVFIIMIILGISSSVSMVKTHEYIHQSIYDDYNIDSTVGYNWFTFWKHDGVIGYTRPNMSLYDQCTDSCRLANENNEIVGYNFTYLIQTIWVICILVFGVWYVKQLDLEAKVSDD